MGGQSGRALDTQARTVEIVDQPDLLDLRHRRSPFYAQLEGTDATVSGVVERVLL